LDELANKVIVENGGIPTFFEYGGFPGYVCISVNDEILHGIGNERKLLPGDLVTYDIGVTYQNRICDSAFSMIVPGKENKEAEDILKATQACLEETVKAVKPGVTTGDLGFITEQTAKKYGYVVIKDFSGHGCGIKLHEEPMVFNYGKRGTGEVLKPGMVICIEPMLLTGSDQYTIDKAND
jgi:methionyl aminopeptidase